MTAKILDQSRPSKSILDYPKQEIEDFLHEKLIRHGVIEAYIFGSYAQKNLTAWSDLDLLIVTESRQSFIERPRQFFDLLDLGIPIDILVYTPEEFLQLRHSGSGFWKGFQENHLKIL
ncbi:MAG: nucleotidyltransferase domain-containing protein [Thermodesulfobacteriota bacterium]|jgi:predicted nucleotidyltransferase|nr:nucleotidyltransferase domain-containing protein [Thermodesulfobacteriota bacterium]